MEYIPPIDVFDLLIKRKKIYVKFHFPRIREKKERLGGVFSPLDVLDLSLKWEKKNIEIFLIYPDWILIAKKSENIKKGFILFSQGKLLHIWMNTSDISMENI